MQRVKRDGSSGYFSVAAALLLTVSLYYGSFGPVLRALMANECRAWQWNAFIMTYRPVILLQRPSTTRRQMVEGGLTDIEAFFLEKGIRSGEWMKEIGPEEFD